MTQPYKNTVWGDTSAAEGLWGRRISCLFIGALLFISGSAGGQQWEPLGPDDFDQVSFSYADYIQAAKGPGESVYVAFQDQSSGAKAIAAKCVGTTWTRLGAEPISTGMAFYTDIAVNSQGVPYVVYQDVAAGYKPTVKKFTGSAWVAVGVEGISEGSGYATRIEISPDDVPYIVYVDVAEGSKPTVKKFSGGAWVTVGAAGFSGGPAKWPSIAIGSDGTPFVVYTDFANGSKATVKKFNGTAWVNAGINESISLGVAEYPEIALSGDNHPYVVYRDVAEGYKTTVKRLGNTLWSTVGQAGFSEGNVSGTTIAIAPNDDVYVAYVDFASGSATTVKKFVNGQWVSVGPEGFAIVGSDSYREMSLVAMNDSILCLAYTNWKANVDRFDGTNWHPLNKTGITQSLNTFNEYTHIAISNNGIPYLALPESYKLPILIYMPPAWVSLPVIPNLISLPRPQIATTSNDQLYAAYLEHDYTLDSNTLNVQYYDGNQWTALNSTGLSYSYISSYEFALDRTGVPYLAFTYFSSGYQIIVKRYNGSAWEPVGDVFPFGLYHFKLAISKDNTPFLAYSKSDTITVKKFSGGVWETVGQEDIAHSYFTQDIEFAISEDGTPYLLYMNGPEFNLTVLRFEAGLWSAVGDVVGSDTLANQSDGGFGLAIAGNTPYVLMQRKSDIKIIVKKWNGQSWVNLGDGPISAAATRYPAISASPDRKIFVMYSSPEVFVKYYDDACTASVSISGPDTAVTNQPLVLTAGAGFTSYQWNVGAGTIVEGQGTAQIQAVFNMVGSTTVSVTVTDAEGCTAKASRDILVKESVGTDAPFSDMIQVSPSPFGDILYFNIDQPAGISRIRAVDAVGRIWWEKTNLPQGMYWVGTASWPAGVYVLQIEAGSRKVVRRLVKMGL